MKKGLKGAIANKKKKPGEKFSHSIVNMSHLTIGRVEDDDFHLSSVMKAPEGPGVNIKSFCMSETRFLHSAYSDPEAQENRLKSSKIHWHCFNLRELARTKRF